MHSLSKVFVWLVIAAFGGAGVLFAAAFVLMTIVWWSSEGTGSDGGAGSALLREWFHDGPRYFEVKVDLEVEGTPVEIRRVMACEPYFFHRFGVGYFIKRWYMTRDAVTQRLPDGSGVIVVVPKLCDEFARPQPPNAPPWGAFPELPRGFAPLMFWTADADNPDILEGYYSFDSLERRDSRVRLISISLRNDPDLAPRTPQGEFGVRDNALYEGVAARDAGNRAGSHWHYTDLNYTAYYLVAIEKDLWSTLPELNAELSRNTDSRFLVPTLQASLHAQLRLSNYDIQDAIRGEMASRLRSAAPAAGNPAQNSHIGVYPLESVNGSSTALDHQEGLILYHRDGTNWPVSPGGNLSFKSITIAWSPDQAHDSFFDSKSGAILELRRSVLSFHSIDRD